MKKCSFSDISASQGGVIYDYSLYDASYKTRVFEDNTFTDIQATTKGEIAYINSYLSEYSFEGDVFTRPGKAGKTVFAIDDCSSLTFQTISL